MSENKFPKVLVVSRVTWDDARGTSSTLSNLFADYDPEQLAQIYIETKQPHTRCCHRFYQISEYALVKRLYKWRIPTGRIIDTKKEETGKIDEDVVSHEERTMTYVRGHRRMVYSYMRDLLWLLDGWKSKELRRFILDFDPDVVWLDGSPLPLMNRVHAYVLKIAQKPASIFMQDDVYTYESCGKNFWMRLYKGILRRTVKRVVDKCDNMFVASPKMKVEYDRIFGVNSTFIAKSIDFDEQVEFKKVHSPIKMVYLGQVIYGRIYSLIAIAEALAKINVNSCKILLDIYTNNQISDELKSRLLQTDSVRLQKPVPYTEVANVISEHDVVVFVESLNPNFCKVARLSFSTKISDYLARKKCILAIGPADSAPIEYFKDEDAAIVVTNFNEIQNQIERLQNPSVVSSYAEKAYICATRNHDRKRMDDIIYSRLKELAQ